MGREAGAQYTEVVKPSRLPGPPLRRALPALGLCLAALTLAGCSVSYSSAPAALAQPSAAPEAPAPLQPLAIGAAAPDFRLTATTGGEVSLSGLRGKPVLVEFLATW